MRSKSRHGGMVARFSADPLLDLLVPCRSLEILRSADVNQMEDCVESPTHCTGAIYGPHIRTYAHTHIPNEHTRRTRAERRTHNMFTHTQDIRLRAPRVCACTPHAVRVCLHSRTQISTNAHVQA